MKTKLLLLCLLPLAACATPVQHNTASGKPEVIIKNVTKQEASDTLSNKLFDVCPNIVTADANKIVCEAPITDTMQQFLLHTDYDHQPIHRITFNFIKVNKKDVRVVADIAGVSNPNSAFERRHDMSRSQGSQQVQQMLYKMKGYMEAGKR